MSPRSMADGRTPSAGAMRHLTKIVESLGEESFGQDLLGFLAETCGAKHCSLFTFARQTPSLVVAASHDGTDAARRQFTLYVSDYWRGDAFMADTMRAANANGLAINHLETEKIADPIFRDRVYGVGHVGERILLCGRGRDRTLGLSILRSEEQGYATTGELRDLEMMSTTLVSLLNKHVSMMVDRSDLSLALTSLPTIEMTIAMSDAALPRREADVCARILYGMSTLGTALDLGISEETVVTYRKRAYQRLSIGSQRELLVWYLRAWGRQGARIEHREIETIRPA